jgi:hypothetical protein
MSTAEVVGDPSPDRRQRSRIANGALLPGTDGRSTWVRHAKEVIADHISDLGGVDNCSAAERSLVRRASTLTVELERLEAKFATVEMASASDLETYQRCANTLRRLLEAVGLQRRPRDTSIIDAEVAALGHADAMETRRKPHRENVGRAHRANSCRRDQRAPGPRAWRQGPWKVGGGGQNP